MSVPSSLRAMLRSLLVLVQIGADRRDFGATVLTSSLVALVASSVCTEVSRAESFLGSRAVLSCGGLGASLAELALGNLELVRDNLQVALEVRVGLLIRGQPVFHRGQVLLRRGLHALTWSVTPALRRPAWPNSTSRRKARPVRSGPEWQSQAFARSHPCQYRVFRDSQT